MPTQTHEKAESKIADVKKPANLSEYDNTVVTVTCKDGQSFTGACEWNPPEYGLVVCDREEVSLKVEENVIFESDIQSIELLRQEVCVPVRNWPEAKEEIAQWFYAQGDLPLEIYRQSIRSCLGNENGLPQWYVVVREDRIIAGCGVIDDDRHEQNSSVPKVCEAYIDEEYKNRDIADFMAQFVCEDMEQLGYDISHLLPDHTEINSL